MEDGFGKRSCNNKTKIKINNNPRSLADVAIIFIVAKHPEISLIMYLMEGVYIYI